MVNDIFTTCTWLLEEKEEWELFVYFMFPASGIALRLTHKCLFLVILSYDRASQTNLRPKRSKKEPVMYLGIPSLRFVMGCPPLPKPKKTFNNKIKIK